MTRNETLGAQILGGIGIVGGAALCALGGWWPVLTGTLVYALGAAYDYRKGGR